MKIGIIGFRQSGKTTVFNALTGRHAQTTTFGGGKTKANIAVVKVPDQRLDRLAEMIQPKKTVHATVEYIDVAGIERKKSQVESPSPDSLKSPGLDDAQLTALAYTDALLAVIRDFEEVGLPPDVPGDIEAIQLEMIMSDLDKVDKRLPKLKSLVKKVAGRQREQNQLELAALEKIKAGLEKETPIRDMDLTPTECKAVRGFTFLSEKPLFFLINVAEDALVKSQGEPVSAMGGMIGLSPDKAQHVQYAAMCAEIEAEITQLSHEEGRAFLDDYHISEPASLRIIRLCYELLGYISFFTVNEKEVHAWTLVEGTPALKAAGAVHSDMEHGFIRAEVVRWEKFLETGGFSQARKTGDLLIEGKEYIVRDGDVINFLFSPH